MFANAPAQPRRAGEPAVAAAPRRRAPRAGSAERRAVRVGNERGSFEARLSVVDRGAGRGVAATTKGHWPKLLAGGENVNAATEERDADLGGGAVFHDCSVWVRAVEPGQRGRGLVSGTTTAQATANPASSAALTSKGAARPDAA